MPTRQPARQLVTRPAPRLWLGILIVLSEGLVSRLSFTEEPSWQVEPVPETLREQLELAPFYQKYIAAADFSIVGSAEVSDHALREAAWIVRHMVGQRADILHAMTANKVRLVVMAWDETTTDVPEHSQLQPKIFWDRRARGLGATLHNPVVSCAEENLLGYPNDAYSTENILIHEFAHAIHGTAGQALGPDFELRLQAAYKNATQRGLFQGTYAGSNPGEYWAEAVQDWFDNNRENDSLHNHVNTRAELKEYDPELAELVADVLGDGPWRYKKPIHRDPAERAHLTGFDATKAPRFRWREAALVAKPQVLIQTTLGDIEVKLDAERAPVTTKNSSRQSHWNARATRDCGTRTVRSRWPVTGRTPHAMSFSSVSATSPNWTSAADATLTARGLQFSAESSRAWRLCVRFTDCLPTARNSPRPCSSRGLSAPGEGCPSCDGQEHVGCWPAAGSFPHAPY